MSNIVPDQRPVWDAKHRAGDHEKLRNIPSPLAKLVEPHLLRNSHILELGCGVGRDTIYFAEHGHQILATDGSEVVIDQDQQYVRSGIKFDVLDMREAFPYEAEYFDAVYANLSLHYYSDEMTRKIVKEIVRVLKSSGVFAFACKSYDSLHNEGVEIEKDVYSSPSGATIHLFSIDYVESLLKDVLAKEYLDEVEEEYNGRFSKIVRCIARKPRQSRSEP